ncbi:Aste57867_22373 [Aphanomyces stellatus]|uniref:Aste57867_22373 protein n=1 Tax=Aphanomyces stellatus TaxID=120398 RepID=A0A485LK70_9STRA|nr:hypothetical protein As57867_022303 [Aphanomyces stellatus]VFT99036.1 Aste57867_22373 [Aphanomyces stellatus]
MDARQVFEKATLVRLQAARVESLRKSQALTKDLLLNSLNELTRASATQAWDVATAAVATRRTHEDSMRAAQTRFDRQAMERDFGDKYAAMARRHAFETRHLDAVHSIEAKDESHSSTPCGRHGLETQLLVAKAHLEVVLLDEAKARAVERQHTDEAIDADHTPARRRDQDAARRTEGVASTQRLSEELASKRHALDAVHQNQMESRVKLDAAAMDALVQRHMRERQDIHAPP